MELGADNDEGMKIGGVFYLGVFRIGRASRSVTLCIAS
jgi:hypothetical protein